MKLFTAIIIMSVLTLSCETYNSYKKFKNNFNVTCSEPVINKTYYNCRKDLKFMEDMSHRICCISDNELQNKVTDNRKCVSFSVENCFIEEI